VRQRDPTGLAGTRQPLFVTCVVREAIGMAYHVQAGGLQDLGKRLAQIAIGEERPAHAARS